MLDLILKENILKHSKEKPPRCVAYCGWYGVVTFFESMKDAVSESDSHLVFQLILLHSTALIKTEKPPPRITSLKTRPCSALPGHDATVCSTVSFGNSLHYI
ncbi:unnamed protein product [Spodoptera exigua]|nr:unnamed protein product [Spodoptera exigua]